jgi:NlpC/P60 family putative phage cell wall peptidase
MRARDEIVAAARRFAGTPYRHQAATCGAGCDCLGLIIGVWRDVYGAMPVSIPPYAADWAEPGGQEPLLDAARRHLVEVATDAAQPGDVLLFRWRAHLPAKHCAILTGTGTMIHAHDGACVAEVALTPWWLRHLAGVFAFPELSGSPPAHMTMRITP